MNNIDVQSKIYVAGHRGLVGSAIVRCLRLRGYKNIVMRTHNELDLLDQNATNLFFENEKPDYVFLAAAVVGGINANNTYPANFIYENLMVQNNVIYASHLTKVKWLCFLGSSCIYPRDCPQPIKEEYLLTGPLEKTNEPYAIAKIAGIELCNTYNGFTSDTRYISVMPTNLYGPNDHYDLEKSHVLPALIRKAHEAKIRGDGEYVVWGSGNPYREFLYADDMAQACIMLMEKGVTGGPINIGFGQDISIAELAKLVTSIVQFKGEIKFDSSKPDGTPRKLLDISKMRGFGWEPTMPLSEGIKITYEDFLTSYDK